MGAARCSNSDAAFATALHPRGYSLQLPYRINGSDWFRLWGAHAPVRGPSPNASDPSLTRLSPANDTLAPRLVPPHDAAERLLVTRGGAGSPRCTGH